MELSEEAILPIIVFFVVPIVVLLIPTVLLGRAIVAQLKKKSIKDANVSGSESLSSRLGWRLPLCVISTLIALSSLAITAYSFNGPGFRFIFGLGTGLLLFVSAPIAVVSAVLIIAKIIADGFSKK